MVSTAMGQKVHFDTAPLNLKPLEYLSYVVPSTIKGDVAYYKGNFYDANRNLLLEDGTSFMKYAKWTKNEAYAAKSIFMKFNATGNLLEFVNYTNNSS